MEIQHGAKSAKRAETGRAEKFRLLHKSDVHCCEVWMVCLS